MNKEEPLGGENILESEGNTPNGRMSTSGEWMTKANQKNNSSKKDQYEKGEDERADREKLKEVTTRERIYLFGR